MLKNGSPLQRNGPRTHLTPKGSAEWRSPLMLRKRLIAGIGLALRAVVRHSGLPPVVPPSGRRRIQGLTPFRRPFLFRPLEASWGPHEWLLEPSRGGLWGSRGHLGASWGCLGTSWELLGDLGAVLSCHGAVLGRGWRHLGTLLGPLGAILRPSWALLGAFLGPLGSRVRHLGALSEPIGACLTERSAIRKMCENPNTYCIFGSPGRPR